MTVAQLPRLTSMKKQISTDPEMFGLLQDSTPAR